MIPTTNCKELRATTRHFTCKDCGHEFPPQLAWAVFEAFNQLTDNKPAWRVCGWFCLQCGTKSSVPLYSVDMTPQPAA